MDNKKSGTMHHAPCTMHHAPKTKASFVTSETGAVTVDWVVLTAAVVGLGIATAGIVQTGLQASSGTLSSNIGASVASQSGGEGGFIQWAVQQALANPASAILSLGGAVAQNTEVTLTESPDMTKPIIVSADVGFQNGRFGGTIFQIKDDVSGERIFLDSPSDGNLRFGGMGNGMTTITDAYTPGEEANISMSFDNTTGNLSIFNGTEKIYEGYAGTFSAGNVIDTVKGPSTSQADALSNLVVTQP